jgi:hypothetical protein
MSYRNIMFSIRKTSRDINHKFRKFQKSKLPMYMETKPKMKLVPVEE